MSNTRHPKGTRQTASTLPVIPEDTTALSLTPVGNTPESICPNELVDPLNLAKFKSWSPAQIQTILDVISSTEFEKSVIGKYATKALRDQLNSLHDVIDEVVLFSYRPESIRTDVINAMKGILRTRLESLLSLYIPKTKSWILAKAHAKSGIRSVSWTAPSIQAIMKANLSFDEILALTSKESLVYKSVQDHLQHGDLTFILKAKDTKPPHKIGPSIFHTRGGGWVDLRNPDEDSWFKKHFGGPESGMVLSYLERRWLAEGFAAFNIIEARYLDLDRRSIGFGSFGTVEGATYRQPGIPPYQVAVKRVRKPEVDENNRIIDPSALEKYEDDISRLAMEGCIMKKAAGPHVVSFLGLLRLEGELVTLYAKGSLKDLAFVKNHHQIISSNLHDWCKQIFSAVRWLHRLGIIHCDIKPSNAYCSSAYGLFLGDFGLAREIPPQGYVGVHCAPGTRQYMPPELNHTDVQLKHSFDVWSSGMTILWIAGYIEKDDVQLYLSKYINLPEDPTETVETRIPDWDAITRFDKIKPYLKLLKSIFTAEENRITGEDVVAELVRMDKVQVS